MGNRPRLFIASSVEGLEVAEAINLNFDHISEVTLWKDAFMTSSITLTSLIERTNNSDFAVFVFTPDDKASIRSVETNIVRDNVLFELGLFIGKLGPERCFVVKPRNADLKIPTDLSGVTLADYDTNRSDGNISASVTAACTKIKQSMKKYGVLQRETSSEQLQTKQKVSTKANNYNDFIESDNILWRLEKIGNIEKYIEYCPRCCIRMKRQIDFVTCDSCGSIEMVESKKPSKLAK